MPRSIVMDLVAEGLFITRPTRKMPESKPGYKPCECCWLLSDPLFGLNAVEVNGKDYYVCADCRDKINAKGPEFKVGVNLITVGEYGADNTGKDSESPA